MLAAGNVSQLPTLTTEPHTSKETHQPPPKAAPASCYQQSPLPAMGPKEVTGDPDALGRPGVRRASGRLGPGSPHQGAQGSCRPCPHVSFRGERAAELPLTSDSNRTFQPELHHGFPPVQSSSTVRILSLHKIQATFVLSSRQVTEASQQDQSRMIPGRHSQPSFL